ENTLTTSAETRTESVGDISTQDQENKNDPVENRESSPVDKIFRNNRGAVTDLPPRRRNRPNYLALVLPYLLCVLAITAPTSTDAVLIRDTVLFQEKPGVVFSESTWTIITDLDLSPAEAAVTVLENKLQEYVEVAARHQKDGSNFMKSDSVNSWRDTTSFMTAEKIEHKLKLFSRDLEVSKKRLTTFRAAIEGVSRPKRAIIDGGGMVLKWLFGVSTQADLTELSTQVAGLTRRDLEIVHLLDKQATVVNESLWEIRMNTLIIQDLQAQTEALKTVTQEILNTMQQHEVAVWSYLQYLTHLDTAFDSISNVLLWLHQLADAFDVGLALFASGHLAPQIFPPAELAAVLEAMNAKLPLG
ncbi:Uncharacterized protein APZ42_004003, partial [Daphnia magna]